MELRHLRYFVATAEKLNFRKAADALNVSQPALSRQIKDLEQEIGVELLQRNTGGVKLTVAGSVFLDEACDILERVDMAVSAAREAHAGKSGRLTIGTVGALSATLLPPALSAFRIIHPKVEVYLTEMLMSEQVNTLRSGQIQLGFTIGRDQSIPHDMDSTVVMESKLQIAVGKDHYLANQKTISLTQLIDEPLAAIHTGNYDNIHSETMKSIFAVRNIRHRPVRDINSYDALAALIGGGHCVSLLTRPPKPLDNGNISYLTVEEDGKDLNIFLSAIWKKGAVSVLVNEFVNVLQDAVTQSKES